MLLLQPARTDKGNRTNSKRDRNHYYMSTFPLCNHTEKDVFFCIANMLSITHPGLATCRIHALFVQGIRPRKLRRQHAPDKDWGPFEVWKLAGGSSPPDTMVHLAGWIDDTPVSTLSRLPTWQIALRTPFVRPRIAVGDDLMKSSCHNNSHRALHKSPRPLFDPGPSLKSVACIFRRAKSTNTPETATKYF
jgi:hypothetical protein